MRLQTIKSIRDGLVRSQMFKLNRDQMRIVQGYISQAQLFWRASDVGFVGGMQFALEPRQFSFAHG